MDSIVVLAGVVLVLAVLAAAFFVMRRRPAAAPPPKLSHDSADRTMVGIPSAPRSDATMVGPAARAGSDATVVDVRATPPAAPPAAAPRGPEAPTVAMSVPRMDATSPTVVIPKLRARVTVTKGGSGTYELEAREHTIGRSSSADIVLADPSVSGRHAQLTPRGDAFALSDLGSTNGTTVDGQAVSGERVLRGGETIGIGDARMRYDRLP